MIENQIISKEICSLTMVRRVAAMLDLEPKTFSEGDILPRGWHFFMLAGATQKSNLRQDGFPGLGVPIPDFDNLPRLLLGGRKVAVQGDIIIGSVLEKTSFVKNITEKKSNSGPMAIVTIQHELRTVSMPNPAIIETQTYILLSANKAIAKSEKVAIEPILSEKQKQFIPDQTLLFQYSALGFNSHKIHLDRDYAQNIEGLPDLVVNGGLTTLLLTEFVRNDLRLEFQEINVKHIAPLYCNRSLTMSFEEGLLKVYDDKNVVAVELKINVEL